MAAIPLYRAGDLPWSADPAEGRRLRIVTTVVLAIALLGGILVPLIPVPEVQREQLEALPPRLAKLVIEKRQPPPPKPKPEVARAEPEPKPRPEPKPEPRPEPKPKPRPEPKPPPPKPASAREKAERAGLLAFRDELADLREAAVPEVLADAAPLAAAGTPGPTRAERSLITSNAGRGSGGINTAALSRDVGGGAGLGSHRTTKVESELQKKAARGEGRKKKAGKKASRSLEELQLVFDKNKGAIYALYNRALRKDPTLQGKVVLELTIAPSGKVTACRVISSELGDPALERKLVARVKLFRFPGRDVDTMVATYPLDFIPG